MDSRLLTLAGFAETELSYAGKFTRFIVNAMSNAKLIYFGMVILIVCIMDKV